MSRDGGDFEKLYVCRYTFHPARHRLRSQRRCDSNFMNYSYSTSNVKLLVNKIGPWDGTVIVPTGAFLFEVHAEGPWTIEFTVK